MEMLTNNLSPAGRHEWRCVLRRAFNCMKYSTLLCWQPDATPSPIPPNTSFSSASHPHSFPYVQQYVSCKHLLSTPPLMPIRISSVQRFFISPPPVPLLIGASTDGRREQNDRTDRSLPARAPVHRARSGIVHNPHGRRLDRCTERSPKTLTHRRPSVTTFHTIPSR